VVPGRCIVVLDYDGHKTKQSFEVALDPRLHPAPDGLQQRLALQLRIQGVLDTLDRSLNEAIEVREGLGAAVAAHKLREAQARGAQTALDEAIGSLVQLETQSTEGIVMHETRLRSHLAYLAADSDLSYDQSTAAHYAVFEVLNGEARDKRGNEESF
jgi:hypothetical protein